MEIVTITAYELAELERLQVKSRRDWPLVFSANCRGDVGLTSRGDTLQKTNEKSSVVLAEF
jgi:hypothetical protein